ncbi:hypothetical protein [Rickettsia endosymbiont of Orchestes rusci]|nr:hypothetical protein [Rickettsia endosymbiont of Ceutorhynchus assimilis]
MGIVAWLDKSSSMSFPRRRESSSCHAELGSASLIVDPEINSG